MGSELQPKLGDIVSFSYDSISTSNFVPIRPQVYRVRNDVFWPNNYNNDSNTHNTNNNNNNINDTSNIYKSSTITAPAVTRNALKLKDSVQDESKKDIEKELELINTSKKLSRMRYFFENTVANQELQIDPFVANNWYLVSPSDVKAIKVSFYFIFNISFNRIICY